ncbi:MAG: hypothetical protein M1821_003649 [Bathelium mastoideum]|nr:MAG: hypothetical protein M1821_003649 [Bathelium mastoideum]
MSDKEADGSNSSDQQQDNRPHERTTTQQQRAEKAQDLAKRDSQGPRSRSASRRARRQRIKDGMESGKYMRTANLDALEEADANEEMSSMQTFERIGPDSTSMTGPVTKARAERGEIPTRGSNPNQPYQVESQQQKGGLQEQDGLKLKLEANLDIEIELKASIRGDLTLSLL